MSTYEEYYDELQSYLKSTHDDKDNVLAMLERSHQWVIGRCGEFDLSHPRGRDLVFNRVRFDFNGLLHEFENHFMNDLSSLSFELMGGEADEET